MVRTLSLGCALLIGLMGAGLARQSAKPDPARLVGSWKVDLRPRPDAPPSYAKFEVTKIEGDTLVGTFYGSEIKNGRLNRDWGSLYFAFTTTDNSGGSYNTTGKLVEGRLEGTTHAVDRKFLAVWKAEAEK